MKSLIYSGRLFIPNGLIEKAKSTPPPYISDSLTESTTSWLLHADLKEDWQKNMPVSHATHDYHNAWLYMYIHETNYKYTATTLTVSSIQHAIMILQFTHDKC